MTINETYQEIRVTTQKVIEKGISIQEKFPTRNRNKISWETEADISNALKNIDYFEKYKILNDEANFNFKMVDGALLQFMYEFDDTGRTLYSHRLAYFPAPHIERYVDFPEEYEKQYFADSEFHDQLEKHVVTSPIRFDYSHQPDKFVDINHPYCHSHFGESESCRIPLSSPITPSIFFNFILRNFYNPLMIEYEDDFPITGFRYNETISYNERQILHFRID